MQQKGLPEPFLKQGRVQNKGKEQERKRLLQRRLSGDKENIMYNTFYFIYLITIFFCRKLMLDSKL